MASYIFDKEYEAIDKDGVSALVVVVHGPVAGQCALASKDNADRILGVTVLPGVRVAVRKAGIARAVAAGPIKLGATVNVAAGGRVKEINEPAGTRINCLGFAETTAAAKGDFIEVYLQFHQRTAD